MILKKHKKAAQHRECSFCSEQKYGLDIDDSIYNLLRDQFGKSRVLYHTNSWYLIPSLGSFTEGYLLSVLKHHRSSLYNCTAKEKEELFLIIKKIEDVFQEKYNKNFVFFEHGNIKGGLHLNSVDHIHIHFIPYDYCIWSQLYNTYHFKYYIVDSLDMITSIVDKQQIHSYILFCDTDHQMYLIDSSSNDYPSQFFRKVLCDLLSHKKDVWNWRENYFIDTMYKTYLTLFDSFNKT